MHCALVDLGAECWDYKFKLSLLMKMAIWISNWINQTSLNVNMHILISVCNTYIHTYIQHTPYTCTYNIHTTYIHTYNIHTTYIHTYTHIHTIYIHITNIHKFVLNLTILRISTTLLMDSFNEIIIIHSTWVRDN